MTRGEAIKDVSDIGRVLDICKANPERLVWVPTRAWRNPLLRALIEGALFDVPNLAILASIDPETTDHEPELIASGWNTMFYGDDSPQATEGRFLCPKTWRDIKGACGTCKAGCFALDAELLTRCEAIDYLNLERNQIREARGGSFLVERELFSGMFQVFFFPG